jgi:membrane-associated protease RseP (regulator of RpoE activity)
VGGEMILFLVSLIIIIILHEASHLIVAKNCNCGVEVYSIGFGKPIFQKKIRGTIYQIAPILFGGFCKLKGELEESSEKDAFINLSYRKKFAISIAGCAINMLLGLLFLFLGKILQNYNLFYFGYLSFILGATNWFIPIPCLDGGYALWFPILTHFYGYKKGIKIFAKAVSITFYIVILLNILCVPLLIKLIIEGAL